MIASSAAGSIIPNQSLLLQRSEGTAATSVGDKGSPPGRRGRGGGAREATAAQEGDSREALTPRRQPIVAPASLTDSLGRVQQDIIALRQADACRVGFGTVQCSQSNAGLLQSTADLHLAVRWEDSKPKARSSATARLDRYAFCSLFRQFACCSWVAGLGQHLAQTPNVLHSLS